MVDEVKQDESDDGTVRVFVYGTLKAGHGNNRALRSSKFLGRGYIDGNFTLVNLGWYPGLIRSGDKTRVYGEVYLVDETTLHTLDLIEGHPNYYERIKVKTEFKNAWVYTLPPEYLREGSPVLEAGVWEPSDEEADYVRSVSQAAV